MTVKNNPELKEFFVRLGTTTAAIVLVMYLAKVWFVTPRLAVLSSQELVSEEVATTFKAEEEALKSVSVPRPLAVPTKVISWRNAAKHYGEHGTVEGTIVATKNIGKVCFLNFDPDWKTTFTAVIFAKRFSAFPPNPENYYLNKGVRVSGRIKEYKGKPEIILEDPSQIEIVKGSRGYKPSAKRTKAKPALVKVDTNGDGIPDTFVLKGEAEKKPVSLAEAKPEEPALPSNLLKATCTRVADGDTITVALSDGSIKNVRLVGIDTPEVWRNTGAAWAEDPEPGAKKASKFTKKEVPLGQAVYLDVDDEELEDHYGRMLALVYTNISDAKKGPRYSLNAKLLQKGHAEVLFIPPSEFDPYSWK